MYERNGIYTWGTSVAAESSVKREIFSLRADQNLRDSDYMIEAYGNPTNDSIDIWMRTSSQCSQKQHRVVRDTPQVGKDVVSWIKELHPLPAREVFDGGPYSL